MEELDQQGKDLYVQKKYKDAIDYYWMASKNNKKWYKLTRSLTVIIGAVVTLTASLTSSELIKSSPSLVMTLTLGTPILAAILTIVAGFSQSFQWGSAWQNMILTAQYLQKELDKYLVTPIEERDFKIEVSKLNDFVIDESQNFFERMLGEGVNKKRFFIDVDKNKNKENE